MLLVDKLVKQADLHINPQFKEAYGALAADLMKTERFVLQKDAVAAMFNVSQTKPTSLINALTWARAPYPLMGVEWAQSDIEAAESPADAVAMPEDKRPHRTGLLIRTIDGSDRGVMTLCWDFLGESVAYFSSIQNLFNWRGQDGDLEGLFISHGLSFPFPVRLDSPDSGSMPILSHQTRKQPESAAERAAAYDIGSKTWSVPCHYLYPRTAQ